MTASVVYKFRAHIKSVFRIFGRIDKSKFEIERQICRLITFFETMVLKFMTFRTNCFGNSTPHRHIHISITFKTSTMW
ncbi:hypothetical protein NC653_001676 [Populus alba x Populus x berolinensis]|uniref:Uncharacterized protein n=1 Tax=Populus alba x Populus x berolinensis TaxID=444605 RepID=A0AAD6WFX0_9ROSI|nr:hypothetical protein NC653_001676 [Populus alba x Populus x berolinensis]